MTVTCVGNRVRRNSQEKLEVCRLYTLGFFQVTKGQHYFQTVLSEFPSKKRVAREDIALAKLETVNSSYFPCDWP
jgi:hypothetical protein